jgi:hypothetical protein
MELFRGFVFESRVLTGMGIAVKVSEIGKSVSNLRGGRVRLTPNVV